MADLLTKWIPGDALALYVPAVTVLAGGGGPPSAPLLVAMIVATPLFTIGSAFAVGRVGRRVWVAALLSGVAFAIWSMSVPLSGWQQWDVVATNSRGFAIGAAVIGILFGYVAEGITLRVNLLD